MLGWHQAYRSRPQNAPGLRAMRSCLVGRRLFALPQLKRSRDACFRRSANVGFHQLMRVWVSPTWRTTSVLSRARTLAVAGVDLSKEPGPKGVTVLKTKFKLHDKKVRSTASPSTSACSWPTMSRPAGRRQMRRLRQQKSQTATWRVPCSTSYARPKWQLHHNPSNQVKPKFLRPQPLALAPRNTR
jgi:hypothetical protein